MSSAKLAATTVALLVATPVLAQQDIFSVTATTNDGGAPVQLTIGGSSLPDLVNDLADQEFDFSSLDGRGFTASVNYGGVEDAIQVTFDPNGGGMGVESLTIQLIGVSDTIPTFVDGAGGEDLGDQLEDFFLRDNPDIIASFQDSLNSLTPIAVGDGNPVAVTARSANYKFRRFGMFQDGTPNSAMVDRRFAVRSGGIALLDEPRRGRASSFSDLAANAGFGTAARTSLGGRATANATLVSSANAFESGGAFAGSTASNASFAGQVGGDSVGWFRSRLDVAASSFDADGGSLRGFDVSVTPSFETSYSDSFSLVLGLPLAYHEIEGAAVYNAGVHLDAPIRLIKPNADDPVALTWQVTPGGSADIGASYDLAAGGVVWSYGVTNLIVLSAGDFDLTLPTGFYLYDSIPVSANDIEFDSGVEQEIFKQGAKLTWHPGDRFALFGGITFTDFLQDAAVDNYWSPTAGLGWTFANGANITIAYEGDIDPSDRFERHGGSLNINIPF